MKLENDTAKNITEIFNRFSNTDEGFAKTRIPVLEACLDREPVSRSQARRICTRLEKFKEVELDFQKIDFMGQGFADEMFRVFHNEHPEIILTPTNMTADVNNMYLCTIHNKVMS